ncbi:hypothetical protein [Nafulsella turpanensis]|uniref:hypothetical protein n=1 Tax=Nafulsella turpanensis TaxID=1265690 RepID=UPI000347C7D7|nr:hypothetical protein [Nafulsella turpanensis]
MKLLVNKMKIKNIFFLPLLSSFLFSCEKEQEFKIPVEVGFYMDIQKNMVDNSRLQLNGGSVIISSFAFEGEREQASEVEFTRDYAQGLKIAFTSDQPVEALQFQIPQGIYTHISIEFESFEGYGENSLLVKGSYQNSEGSRYPLIFAMNSSESFEIEAVSYSDGSQIIIKKEAPVSAYIKLNPVHWFKNIPLALLDEADVMDWDGVPSIVISEEENEEIYDLIEDQLNEAAEVTFVY